MVINKAKLLFTNLVFFFMVLNILQVPKKKKKCWQQQYHFGLSSCAEKI